MNLIELLVVLAAANSSVPLAARPLMQVQDTTVVEEVLPPCHCMPVAHVGGKVGDPNKHQRRDLERCKVLVGLGYVQNAELKRAGSR